jgi:L-threonylcarbamoyladenylate synthase
MNKIINIDTDFNGAVETAINAFNEGKIFIYPTDTVYGIGGDPFIDEAGEKINSIKGRDEAKRFILLIDTVDHLLKYIESPDPKNMKFLMSIWPNPISVILPLNKKTREITGLENCAFRIPFNDFCMSVLKKIKKPLISTSVNRSGSVPMNKFEAIHDEFANEVDYIFYREGESEAKASTLVDMTGGEPLILREGVMKRSEIFSLYNSMSDEEEI